MTHGSGCRILGRRESWPDRYGRLRVRLAWCVRLIVLDSGPQGRGNEGYVDGRRSKRNRREHPTLSHCRQTSNRYLRRRLLPRSTALTPAYVKFDLTTQKVTARLAEGVGYDCWTFNGTVPGPMLRVREGDTVEIDLHNAADAGVTHSMDLDEVTGPGGGAKVMQIPPGEDGSFKFQALNPGVYIYHCATRKVAEHIASGMYGIIVVEPKAGLPKVDREFYLMEGDFYLQGQRGDTGLRAFDLTKFA